jgi:uncharacterized membrane protein
MNAMIVFGFPDALLWGLPAAALLMAWSSWSQRRAGLSWSGIGILVALRLVLLIVLILLAAQPTWINKGPGDSAGRSVTLLLDRSESMSLEENESTRYQQALGFLRQQILPALKSAALPIHAMVFSESAELVDSEKLGGAQPTGKRTNLGHAIVQALAASDHPPMALIALTDGIANVAGDNARALSALVEQRVPFIGLGFGSDQGARTLLLRQVSAPPTVPSKTAFSLSAQLEVMNGEELPPFDLLLFRDGQLQERKTVTAGKDSRQWLEHFRLTEDKEGVRNYTVQLIPPNVPRLKCPNTLQNATVRISRENEVRLLYVQGALTWDYKFISRALHNDPAIKITGLSRTSQQSFFRQNVEGADELLNGFPTTLEEIAPFRIVVLSNLKASDLSPTQQEILARFCSELGGGLLLLGGPSTFDSSWQHSRLEQVLPVVFSPNSGVPGSDHAFRMELTEQALQHPVFQVTDGGQTRETWRQLPTFTQYASVEAAKPGAMVWARHQTDDGSGGKRILMAVQRYGAGLSAVICVQNFWRWRLAKDAQPQQFDRFWRQLLRFLGDIARQDVVIYLADQDLHPQMDVQLVIEKQPNPGDVSQAAAKFFVQVEDAAKKVLREETMDLKPSRPVDVKFRAEKEGLYCVNVLDALKKPVATRSIDIRDINVEFQDTARNMETLRQWAAVSGGFASKAEDCHDAGGLVARIKSKIEQARRTREIRHPLGVNGWALSLVLVCIAGEWILRKRWGLV